MVRSHRTQARRGAALATVCVAMTLGGCAGEQATTIDTVDAYSLRMPPVSQVGEWAEYRGDSGGVVWSSTAVVREDDRGEWIEFGQQRPGEPVVFTAVAYQVGEPVEAYRGDAGSVGRPLRITPMTAEQHATHVREMAEQAASAAGRAEESKHAANSARMETRTRRERLTTPAGEFDCVVEEHTLKMLLSSGRITVWKSDRVPFGGMVRYRADYGVGPAETDELTAFGLRGATSRLDVPPRGGR